MSMEIPQGVIDHVQELCQRHNLLDPASKTLKQGWEDKISDLIQDSRFVVIGAGKDLKDLSAVYVGSPTLIGRIFWGAVGPFTPSYWNSHYATENEVRAIFRAVLEQKGPVSEGILPGSEEERLDVPRRTTGPSGRRPPSRKPFESRYQEPKEPSPTEGPAAEPQAPPAKPRSGNPATAALAAAAMEKRAALKPGTKATPASAASTALKNVDDFVAALQTPTPNYDDIAKQLLQQGEFIQRAIARNSAVDPSRLQKLIATMKALKSKQ